MTNSIFATILLPTLIALGGKIWRSTSRRLVLWRHLVRLVSWSVTFWRRQSKAIVGEGQTWCLPHSTFCAAWMSVSSTWHDRSQPREANDGKLPSFSFVKQQWATWQDVHTLLFDAIEAIHDTNQNKLNHRFGKEMEPKGMYSIVWLCTYEVECFVKCLVLTRTKWQVTATPCGFVCLSVHSWPRSIAILGWWLAAPDVAEENLNWSYQWCLSSRHVFCPQKMTVIRTFFKL